MVPDVVRFSDILDPDKTHKMVECKILTVDDVYPHPDMLVAEPGIGKTTVLASGFIKNERGELRSVPAADVERKGK